MRYIIAGLALVFTLLVGIKGGSPVLAQSTPQAYIDLCETVVEPYKYVVYYLTADFQEDVKSVRKGSYHGRVELWASENTGTWTVLFVFPEGACFLGHGEGWKPDKVSFTPA